MNESVLILEGLKVLSYTCYDITRANGTDGNNQEGVQAEDKKDKSIDPKKDKSIDPKMPKELQDALNLGLPEDNIERSRIRGGQEVPLDTCERNNRIAEKLVEMASNNQSFDVEEMIRFLARERMEQGSIPLLKTFEPSKSADSPDAAILHHSETQRIIRSVLPTIVRGKKEYWKPFSDDTMAHSLGRVITDEKGKKSIIINMKHSSMKFPFKDIKLEFVEKPDNISITYGGIASRMKEQYKTGYECLNIFYQRNVKVVPEEERAAAYENLEKVKEKCKEAKIKIVALHAKLKKLQKEDHENKAKQQTLIDSIKKRRTDAMKSKKEAPVLDVEKLTQIDRISYRYMSEEDKKKELEEMKQLVAVNELRTMKYEAAKPIAQEKQDISRKFLFGDDGRRLEFDRFYSVPTELYKDLKNPYLKVTADPDSLIDPGYFNSKNFKMNAMTKLARMHNISNEVLPVGNATVTLILKDLWDCSFDDEFLKSEYTRKLSAYIFYVLLDDLTDLSNDISKYTVTLGPISTSNCMIPREAYACDWIKYGSCMEARPTFQMRDVLDTINLFKASPNKKTKLLSYYVGARGLDIKKFDIVKEENKLKYEDTLYKVLDMLKQKKTELFENGYKELIEMREKAGLKPIPNSKIVISLRSAKELYMKLKEDGQYMQRLMINTVLSEPFNFLVSDKEWNELPDMPYEKSTEKK